MNGVGRKGELGAQPLPALPAPASLPWLRRDLLPLKFLPAGLGQELPVRSQCRGRDSRVLSRVASAFQ